MITYQDVLDFILDTVAKYDGVDRDCICSHSTFYRVGLDFIDIYGVLTDVEKEYDIYLNDAGYSGYMTIADLAQRVVEVIKESR